jgi:dienelactone hydrolase
MNRRVIVPTVFLLTVWAGGLSARADGVENGSKEIPDRLGMIGYSAGGVVTSETLFGPMETRPNFAAIIYGAGEFKEMPQPAPPLFLAVTADDAMAVARSIELFTLYRKQKGQAELHVFQMGAHGFVNKGGGADHYLDRLEEWLATNKLLTKPAN